jgi:hypothetical protein
MSYRTPRQTVSTEHSFSGSALQEAFAETFEGDISGLSDKLAAALDQMVRNPKAASTDSTSLKQAVLSSKGVQTVGMVGIKRAIPAVVLCGVVGLVIGRYLAAPKRVRA